jgi:thioester reductase-like protein
VIDCSVSSFRRSRIVFITSPCAVGNWPALEPIGSEVDPEDEEGMLQNPAIALQRGYSKAKWVCERILEIESLGSATPVSIVRISQVGVLADEDWGDWRMICWWRG